MITQGSIDVIMKTSHDLIREHLTHMSAAGLRPATIHAAGVVLRRLSRDLHPQTIATASRSEWEDWLSGRHPKTIDTYLCHIQRLGRWLLDEGYTDVDSTAKLKHPHLPRRLPRPATDEQVRLLLELPRPWPTRFGLAAYAGLRVGEIARLDRSDVSSENIRVQNGKGGRDRYVPTDPRLWALLCTLPPGPIVRKRGAPPTGGWLSVEVRRQLAPRRMPVTMHELRHWYATRLLDAGVDIRIIQVLLGHASLSSTEIYTYVSTARLRVAASALPDMFGEHQLGDSQLVPTAAR